MSGRHWRPKWFLAVALFSILGGGALFAYVEGVSFVSGVYFALVTDETVGYGDVIPRTGHGRLIASLVMVVGIPALGATYAWLGTLHMRARLRDDLTEVQATAEKANRIAADTYRHHTGRDHPDAPAREDTRA